MAFKAGAVIGEAILDTQQWKAGEKYLSQSKDKLVKGLNNLAMAGFATVGVAMVASTMKAQAFAKEIANVSTLTDMTADDISKLRKDILSLNPAFGTSTELAKGMYQAISAGAAPGAEALQVVEKSAIFAQAALTDTATAVDILTTATNAYGKEIMSAEMASDLFFTTIKQGKINGEQLSAVIGQSIPLFASAGIEMKQLTAGIAAMTKQGVAASETTTQMNAIVNAMLKPTDELAQLINEYGYETGAAMLKAEGLEGVLKMLETATGGNADELAKFLPNIRAMRGAMALTGTGGEEFTKILREMENATGATQEAFDKQDLTVKTALNTFDRLMVIVGEVGRVFLDEMMVGASSAAGALTEFLLNNDTMEDFKKIAVDIGKSIGETAMFIKDMVTGFMNLSPQMRNAILVGGALIGVMIALNAAMGPIAVGLAGVAALGYAFSRSTAEAERANKRLIQMHQDAKKEFLESGINEAIEKSLTPERAKIRQQINEYKKNLEQLEAIVKKSQQEIAQGINTAFNVQQIDKARDAMSKIENEIVKLQNEWTASANNTTVAINGTNQALEDAQSLLSEIEEVQKNGNDAAKEAERLAKERAEAEAKRAAQMSNRYSNLSDIGKTLHGNMSGLIQSSFAIADNFARMSDAMGDSQTTAKEWVSAIIAVVNELKQMDNGLGRLLTIMTDVQALFKDVSTALLSLLVPFGFIKAWVQSARDGAEEAKNAITDMVEKTVDSITAFSQQAQLSILDVQKKVAIEIARTASGIMAIRQEISDLEKQIQDEENAERKSSLEEQLRFARDTGNKELELETSRQLRLMELREEEARVAEELKKREMFIEQQVALKKLQIERAMLEAKQKMRVADLEAQEASAMAEASKIFKKSERLEQEALITAAYKNAYSSMDDVSDIEKQALDLQEAFLKGDFSSMNIPQFAEGTNFAPGGLAMVGEAGPELVNLPRGSQVFTADETERMGITVNINNASVRNDNDIRSIAEQVSEVLSRRLQLA